MALLPPLLIGLLVLNMRLVHDVLMLVLPMLVLLMLVLWLLSMPLVGL